MNGIDTRDRLVLFGYGVFETLRINGKHIEVPKLHYNRMSRGAKQLGLSLPNYSIWVEGLREIVSREQASVPYALRLTLSGGGEGKSLSPQLFHSIRSLSYTEADYIQGISLCYLSNPRNEYSPLIHIKSTNMIENLLAKEEAKGKGAREGLWLNTKGHLTEGTVSNLFFINNETLYTPALNCGCLPGTRRNIVLECAHQLRIPVREGQFSPLELQKAEEVFLTNALMGILPVRKVEEQIFDFRRNSVTARLSECFKSYIQIMSG